MSLISGGRIGPFEIIGAIGEGGMGQVYRARDTALNRDVAIKVLPIAFADDADRLARFEREAQALASLNHPNIAQVFAIETVPPSDAAPAGRAIVMELVEGRDLSEVIPGAPGLRVTDALPIARQIALALEAAHTAGIIHRDLKPANIKVREDGTVKVLDFGLAKASTLDSGPGPQDLANSPTLTARATELGVILGTAAYMAPEQAKGRAVDRRADVWAFGVVLYEMLTGRRAFSGEDVTEVMAAVIRDTPDLKALPADTPTAVRRLLRRCLEKDPRKRLRDMGDVGVELDEALSAPEADERSTPAMAAAPHRRSPLTMVVAAAALVAMASLVTWALIPTPVVDRPITRFAVELDAGQQLKPLGLPEVALSGDGRRLAYRVAQDNNIIVRDFDQTEARVVTQAQGAGIWFSPDGETLLYWDVGTGGGNDTGLWKVPVSGGPSLRVVASGTVAGVDWGADDTIVYANDSGIFRVPAAGGAPVAVYETPAGQGAAWPQFLPDGAHVLFSLWNDTRMSLEVIPITGGDTQTVSEGLAGARYLPTGHLVYGLEGRLMAQAFDLEGLKIIGPAVPMPESVSVANSDYAQAVFSRTGTLAYVTGGTTGALELAWANEKGGEEPAFTVVRNYSDVRLSPDGRRVVAHLWDQDNDIWVADLQRGGLTRITFTPEEEETPVWSPDGTELAYSVTRGTKRLLIIKSADGSAAAVERQVWEADDHFHVNDWSHDGKTLIIEVAREATRNDLVAIDVDTGEARDLLTSPYNEYNARLSPDGKWLAYVSTESGNPDVYVQPFPALNARVPVSTAGGLEPVWSRDGRRLFFRTTSGIMVADVTATTPLEFGRPQVVMPDRYVRTQGNYHTHYDVSADGRLLMIRDPKTAGDAARSQIHVVLNWFESLKQAAPAGR